MHEKIKLIHIEEGEFPEVDSALEKFQQFYTFEGLHAAARVFVKLRARCKEWFRTHENCMNFDLSFTMDPLKIDGEEERI